MLKSQVLTQLREIVSIAIKAQKGHLWYLTEKLVPFALGSNQLAPDAKDILACKLFCLFHVIRNLEFNPLKPSALFYQQAFLSTFLAISSRFKRVLTCF